MFKEYRISEIGEVIGGGTPSTKNEEYWNGDVPWISPKDLTGFTSVYISHGESNITEKGLNKSGTKLLPKNTVLFSSRAPIGYVALASNPICTNQGFKSIVCNEKLINPLYLYYYLKANLDYIKLFGTGATFPEISGSALRNIKINIFENIEQQAAVAKAIYKYDELIEVNNQRIKKLEQMAEELYKEWFVRFRFPNWHNTEFENGIPKGWEYKSLFEIGKVDYGYAFSSNLFCDDNTLNPVVRIRDIQDNKTNTFTPEICDDKYLISENSILVGMDGIFHMCLWNGSKAFLNQRVVMINSIYANYCNYLLYLSLYPQVKFWEAVIAGTTVAHLGDKHLKKMKILIPNDEFLKEYNPIFESLMVQKNRVMKQNDNLIKQRDLLLPRLMSGKLEV